MEMKAELTILVSEKPATKIYIHVLGIKKRTLYYNKVIIHTIYVCTKNQSFKYMSQKLMELKQIHNYS